MLLFFVSLSLSAQDLVITMETEADTLLKGRYFYFDKVTDFRGEQSNDNLIGVVGEGNKKKNIVLSSGIEAHILKFLNQLYPKRESDTVALTFIINDMNCKSTSQTLSKELMVTMDVDFSNSQTNQMLTNISLERSKEMLSLNKNKVEELLEEAIGMAVQQFFRENKQ